MKANANRALEALDRDNLLDRSDAVGKLLRDLTVLCAYAPDIGDIHERLTWAKGALEPIYDDDDEDEE